MKKLKKTIVITVLLSIFALIIYCIVDQNKSASALFETDSKYVKYTLPSGLNIISIDLGGLIDSNRVNGSYGDATLIEQGGHYLLVDTGDRKLDDNGNEIDNNVLIKFLKSQQVKNLDIYISHYHIDHYGKVEAILKDSYFNVGTVYLPDPRTFSGRLDSTWYNQFSNWFSNYKQKILDSGANVMLTKKTVKTTGQTNEINIGEAKLKVIWDFLDCDFVPDDFPADKLGSLKNHFINNTSLVSMVTYKGKKFLMAGDIEERIEQKILDKKLNVDADIFKLSHHGGVSSNISAFLDAVSPMYSYMPNNAEALENKSTFWQGDRTYSFTNYAGITYNDNIRFGSYKNFVNNIGSYTNLYSTLYNGNTLFNISTDGNITTYTTRNYHTVTVKHIDIDTNSQIQNQVKYKFNDRSVYHLDKVNYNNKPIEYAFISSTYTPNQILTSDKTVVCNYQKKKINVNYSTTNKTNGNVVVTMTANTELKELNGWTLSSDKKKLTKTYTANKSEEIQVLDEEGYTIKAQVQITNIDKTAPTASVTYSTTNPTNQNVTATITANEVIQGITGWTLSTDKKKLTKIYSENKKETVVIKDLAGNEVSKTIEIANIDKVAPTVTVNYSTTDLTNKNVTVTITGNEKLQQKEDWVLSENKLELEKQYERSVIEEIEVKDIAGNSVKKTIEITNIDKDAPKIEGVHDKRTYANKATPKAVDENLASVKLEKDGQEIEGYVNGTDVTEVGSYKITATDELGQKTELEFYIKNIPPIREIIEYTVTPEGLTNQDVTVRVTKKENEEYEDLVVQMSTDDNNYEAIGEKTLSENGIVYIKAVKDNGDGNIEEGEIFELKVENIDKTAPTTEVTYSNTEKTNQNVTATITANEEIQEVEGWTLSQDNKELTKEYSTNNTETVIIKDLAGNEVSRTIEITNIDKTEPEIQTTYSEINPTNQNVTVTITANEELQEVEGWTLSQDNKELTKEYSTNNTETVIIKDLAGNEVSSTIEITNIDKTEPEIQTTYSEINPTNQNVIVTITANEEIQEVEGWTLSQDNKQLTKVYEQNSKEKITIKDIAGNQQKANVEITNIDKTEPEIQIIYSEKDLTNQNVTVTIIANEEIQEVEGWTLLQDDKQLIKEYEQNVEEEITIKDIAGNQQKANVEITNIDKTEPEVQTAYSEINLTNQNVTVTLTANEEIQEVEGWTLSQNNKQLTKVYEQNVKEEIKIKDIAGNQKKVSIEITNIDKTSPVITGVENGESYIGSVRVLVTDDNLKTLLLERNGEKVEEYTNGEEIVEEGSYKLTAIDKVENTTIVNFTIEQKRGELNGNDQIDIGDILLILRHIAQANDNKIYQTHPIWRLEEKRQKVADVNNNNRVDIGDILKLRRYMAAKNSKEIANKHPDWLNL